MKKPTGPLRTELISAAQDFLETMVIIDDQLKLSALPTAPPKDDSGKERNIKLNVPKFGTPRKKTEARVDTEFSDSKPPPADNGALSLGDSIDMHALLRGSASQGLICSLVDPTAFTKSDVVGKLRKTLSKADICVLDWRITGFDPGELSLELLKELVQPATATRHRVFCIYSHFEDPENAFQKVQDSLGKDFKREGKKFVLKFRNILVIWLAKERQELFEGPERVAEEVLASRLVEAFALHRPGLIPLFALKALASVRHHTLGLLARYNSSSDHGFVADMTLQSDVATCHSHVAEALADDMSILAKTVFDDNWLPIEALEEWFGTADLNIEPAVLGLDDGADEVDVQKAAASTIKVGGSSALREALAMKLTETNESSLKNYAELLCCEMAADADTVHLKPGTVVKVGQSFFVCAQPICDCYIRGNKAERRFPFVPLSADRSEPHIAFQDGRNARVMYVRPKLYELTYFKMKRSSRQSVDLKDGKYEATGEEPVRHVACLRSTHAQRVLAMLGHDAGRVGLSESEYFRKKARDQSFAGPTLAPKLADKKPEET